MNRFWLIPLMLSLTSCSTLMDRSTQEVRFESIGAENVMCIVDTGHISYKVFPPIDVILMKTDKTLQIHCKADGNRDKFIVIEPILSNNTMLNAGNLIFPGTIIDQHTDAPYIYPDVITIDFTNIPYRKFAQPSYMNGPLASKIEHIDPKRGGVPALSDDDFIPAGDPPLRASRSYLTDNPDSIMYTPSKPVPIK